MTDDPLTHQEIDEIQDMLGLALMPPDATTNDLVDMLDQVCRDLKAARQEIGDLNVQLDALVTQLGDTVIEIARLEDLLDEEKPSGTWVYPPKDHSDG